MSLSCVGVHMDVPELCGGSHGCLCLCHMYVFVIIMICYVRVHVHNYVPELYMCGMTDHEVYYYA